MNRIALLAALALLLTGCGRKYVMADPSPHDFRSYDLGEVQTVEVGDPMLRVEAGFGFSLFYASPAIQPPSFNRGAVTPWPDGKRLIKKAHSHENPDEIYLEDPETLAWISVTSDGRILRGWVSPMDASPLPQGPWPEEVRFLEDEDALKTETTFQGVLVFSGKDGDTLALTYAESPEGPAGPTSLEDLRYDLSEGRSITFRTLRIEILEASQTSLTFRVISDDGLPWLIRR